MSAYREAEFQAPCARCNELSSWTCACCNEPRCADDLPEYGPWCESCEERFGEFVARERLYMVPVRSRDDQVNQQPAYWRWYHDVQHTAIPTIAGAAGALAAALLLEGVLLPATILALVTGALLLPAIRQLREPPAKKLERRIRSARRHFVKQRSLASGDRRDRS